MSYRKHCLPCYGLLIIALLGTSHARSRVTREVTNFWWLTGEVPQGDSYTNNEDASQFEDVNQGDSNARNPTLGALVAANRPGSNDGSFSNLYELESLLSNSQIPADVPCECVPYYQCKEGNVISDGAGIIDIRVGQDKDDDSSASSEEDVAHIRTNSKCPLFLDVCCKSPDTNATAIVSTETYKPRCGRVNFDGVIARVSGIGANQAQFAEFPHMAAVLRVEKIGSKETKIYICGGSLIAPHVILTAAHCVKAFEKTPEMLMVRLGEWNTQRTHEPYSHVDRRVSKIIAHENFHSYNLQNDYAILQLDCPVSLSPHIDTACLPQYENEYDPRNCYVTGWGKDEFGSEGTYQNILKKVFLPVVEHKECQKRLRTTRLGKHFVLDSSFLCAGGEANGNDACKGDGGSPLICRHKTDISKYIQVGMVAWGIGCGTPGIPGVYVNITTGHNWIQQKVANLTHSCYNVL